MNGIRITGQPLFAEIFQPILGELNGLTWLTGVGAFRLPLSWADDSVYDEATDSFVSGPAAELDRDVHLITDERGVTQFGCYARADVFPKYAGIVEEDWNAIFGMDRPIQNPLAWWDGYYDATSRAAYLNGFYVCFLSIDGGCWEFYTREPRLLEMVERHLKGLDVGVSSCKLEESEGL